MMIWFRRFDEFKYCVHHVHRVNNLDLDIRLGLNKNSDIPLSEMYSSTPMISDEAYERFKALGGCTIEFDPPTDHAWAFGLPEKFELGNSGFEKFGF